MFSFSFLEMVDWYNESKDNIEYFENDSQCIAIFIQRAQKYESLSDRQIKKLKSDQQALLKDKKRKGYLGMFVKQNINQDNIRRVKFIEKDPYIQHGLYYVKQDDHNLFFVYPTLKMLKPNVFALFADHLSFPFVSKLNEIHLHVTSYLPIPVSENVGDIIHAPRNVFKNGLKLPLIGYDTNAFDQMNDMKDNVLDICRAYKTFERAHGGSGRGRVTKYKRHIMRQSNNRETKVYAALENLLINLRIKRVNAFGLKNDQGKWKMTVDLVRHEESQLEFDFTFELENPNDASFQRQLVGLLKNIVVD